MGHRYKWVAVMLLALATACGGPPTEEERLRTALDTTSVHMYIALKIAVADPARVPEAAAARQKILEATVASIPLVQAAAVGFENRLRREAPPLPAPEVHAADVIVLARALLALRSAGRAMLLDERDRTLPPVLPLLIANTPLASTLGVELDANLEHAFLLMTFFTLKMHPKVPIPLPHELLLYEASRTDADTLALESMRTTSHGLKAFVYAQTDLCDLAVRESNAVPDSFTARDAATLRSDMTRLGAVVEGLDEAELMRFLHSMRGMAHGSVALCYLGRDDFARAKPALETFRTSAEAAGIPLAETAPIHAYLAYEAGDMVEAVRFMRIARANPRLGQSERARFDEVIAHLEAHRGDALDAYFDRAFFTIMFVQIALDGVERSGVGDAASDTPLAGALRGYVTYAGRSLEHLRATIPTVPTPSASGASGVWAWITGLF